MATLIILIAGAQHVIKERTEHWRSPEKMGITDRKSHVDWMMEHEEERQNDQEKEQSQDRK